MDLEMQRRVSEAPSWESTALKCYYDEAHFGGCLQRYQWTLPPAPRHRGAPRKLLPVNLTTQTTRIRLVQRRFYRRLSQYWALLYTNLCISITTFVPCTKEQLRTRTLLMNIQYLMFFYFVLSLTFIKVKPQASLKSLRTMKELLCYSFRLDVEFIF